MTTQTWVNIGSGKKKCLVAWWHQASTSNYMDIDLSSVKSHDIQLRALSFENLKIQINKTSMKKAFLK